MVEQTPARQQASVVAIAAPVPDVRILRVRLADSRILGFEAGQYVRLWFGALPPREYSLGNRPGERDLEFHIRVNAERGAGKYVGEQLKVGHEIGVAGPFGAAFLRRDHKGPVLAIAGGTGIVPIRSIVATALATGMTAPLHLYWGARTAADLYAEAGFLELARAHRNLTVVCSVVEPDKAAGHPVGNVSDLVAGAFPWLSGFKCYVAGPPTMVVAAQRVLLSRGVPEGDVHADPFVPGDHHSSNVVVMQ